ncbi:MAG: hypothetical protein O2954_07655, partial [bacterium]|nr:hypothetical protein [bacterium]
MDAHFDGVFGAVGNFTDFAVAQAFYGAKDEEESEGFGQGGNGGLYPVVEFFADERLPVGRTRELPER